MNKDTAKKTAISLIPLVVLVCLLSLAISIFGSDSMSGSSQVALLFSAGVCIWLSTWLLKTPWKSIEGTIMKNISDISIALILLFLIGGISGTWTMSGIMPTLICYGIKIISPKFFLLTACIIAAIVSVMTGSSWTTIATIGVALLGIGRAEGFSDAMIAGAIISGAYFGDKMSPLSDTTVMAASVNGVQLFEHIRYMMVTTVPAMVITLIIFTVLGLSHDGNDASSIAMYVDVLNETFHITPWLLIVPALTGFLIYKKLPAVFVLAISIVIASITAVIFQPEVIKGIGASVAQGNDAKLMLSGVVRTVYDSVSLDTGNVDVNELVATRGMNGMLSTVFLIICAMFFGGCMKASGMIQHLASLLIPLTKRRTGLVTSTIVSGILFDCIVCDQYLSILLTSNIFGDIYKKKGYENRLLSRSIEDSSTLSSPLIPWTTCGMTQSTILSVPTLTYLPFCFFNILSPLVSIAICAAGYKIFKTQEQ